MSERHRRIRASVDEHLMQDGCKLFLLGEGRLVNFAAAEGHPAAVMDTSFANQALGAEWIAMDHSSWRSKSTNSPTKSMRRSRASCCAPWASASIYLTEEQKKHPSSWREGT